MSVAGEVELPAVPADIMRPANTGDATVSNSHTSVESAASTPLILIPGVNELAPIALGHLNRIVTPFDGPRIRTTNDAQTQIVDNVVYLATDNDTPVALYITPADTEQPALSLTLVPKRIPPRELTLRLAEGYQPVRITTAKAARWETADTYTDTLRALFRALALNVLPPGYGLRPVQTGEHIPHCFQPGSRFDFTGGQVLTGHHFTAYVGVVRSFAERLLALKAVSCHSPSMAAGAFWPKETLLPGEQTEVFIVMRKAKEADATVTRPSLLPGGQP